MSMHEIRLACQPVLIIVRGRTLVLRANAKKIFLTNRPQWWLALYGYLRNNFNEVGGILLLLLLVTEVTRNKSYIYLH
jgi:hypothetical protein